jgi:hypothetical protein
LKQELATAVQDGYSIRVYDENIGGWTGWETINTKVMRGQVVHCVHIL